ncbi:MAG: glycosyltransferase family 9 protein [bacterium]|nr:glycosyltransferase family 9 protein [bacterium]
MKKINVDYLNLWKEIPFFCLLIVKKFFVREEGRGSGNILIVNPSLVGEFAASVPAIRDYIERHPGKNIDLIVSPPLQKLAQHLIGIRHVYTTASVFARASEQAEGEQSLGAYEKTVVLRMSPAVYRLLKNTHTGTLKTSLPNFIDYALHLAINLIIGRTPRSWRVINFEMLGGTPKDISFDELFSFDAAERERVAALPAFAGKEKKIFIHTGASWVLNKWRNEKWVETLTRLNTLGNFRFIFIGANKDSADYEFISSQLSFKTYSLVGAVDWQELVLAFRQGGYFIGVDSGPRNLAHLADLPSITLLGPGPHMFTPHNARDIILDHSGGRGLYQRFVHTEKNHFIDKIQSSELVAAFQELITRCAPGSGSRP